MLKELWGGVDWDREGRVVRGKRRGGEGSWVGGKEGREGMARIESFSKKKKAFHRID